MKRTDFPPIPFFKSLAWLQSQSVDVYTGTSNFLHLEGGHIAGDSVVEDNVVHGHILARQQLDGLMGRTAAQEGGHRVELSPPVATQLVHMLVLGQHNVHCVHFYTAQESALPKPWFFTLFISC